MTTLVIWDCPVSIYDHQLGWKESMDKILLFRGEFHSGVILQVLAMKLQQAQPDVRWCGRFESEAEELSGVILSHSYSGQFPVIQTQSLRILERNGACE